MNRDKVHPDDPQLTAFSLGEMTASEMVEFETRLERSPQALAELEAMSGVISALSSGLKHEWENQESVSSRSIDPSDPELTAYALGEMTSSESASFEVRLRGASDAQKDLASMSEMMSMLSVGLKQEWEGKMAEPSSEKVDVSEKVVAFEAVTNPRKALLGVAAAAAAIVLALVSLNVPSEGPVIANDWGSGDQSSQVDPTIDSGDTSFKLVGLASAASVNVPQLFMADEVDDVSELDLAASLGEQGSPLLDASYLDSSEIEEGSLEVQEMTMIPVSFSPAKVERIDSYLPPAGHSDRSEQRMKLIRERLERDFVMSPFPVVLDTIEDEEVRLAAEFQKAQADLETIIDSMPSGSDRSSLELVWERNERILNQLRLNFAE
ncbi:MAG: hypothetical protein AAGA96_20445 [Verrucomicrobiota bacterium]